MNRVNLPIMLLVGFIILSCSRQDKVVSPVFRIEGTVIPTDSLQNGYVVINADTNEILIEASKESFFFESYKLKEDSACLFHRYGKRGEGPNELIEANSILYYKPTRNMLLYSINDMGAQLINLDTYNIRPIHSFRQNNALWLMKAEFINDSTFTTPRHALENIPIEIALYMDVMKDCMPKFLTGRAIGLLTEKSYLTNIRRTILGRTASVRRVHPTVNCVDLRFL